MERHVCGRCKAQIVPAATSGQVIDFQVIGSGARGGGGVRFRSVPVSAGHDLEPASVAAGPPRPATGAPGPLDGLLHAPELLLDLVSPAVRRDLPELVAGLGLPLTVGRKRLSWQAGGRRQAGELDAGRVAAALAGHLAGIAGARAVVPCPVETSLLVDSTNSVLLAAAAAGVTAPRALLAHCQSAGRGRHRRPWHGRWGEAILLSLLLDSGRPLAQLPGFSLVAGVAVAQALVDSTGLPPGKHGIGLKWPNDLVHRGGKLGGILLEAAGSGDAGAGARAVIGLGLNWLAPADLKVAAGQPVAALTELPGVAGRDRATVAGAVIAQLLVAAARFRAEGLAPFLAAFTRFDVLAGEPVRIITGTGQPLAGQALGLAGDGALRVRHGRHERCYHSADVSVRPA